MKLEIASEGGDVAERDYVRWYPARIRPMDAARAWTEDELPLPRLRRVGLYLHIPFCAYRCHFCRYKVITGPDLRTQIADFVELLLIEIDHVARLQVVDNAQVDVLFVGGGTPSLLEPHEIDLLMERLRAHFTFTDDAEITFEGSPSSFTSERLRAMHGNGANRVSMGIQSLDDAVLGEIGRDHTAAEARAAMRRVHAAGIENVNVDFIYRLPGLSAARVAEIGRSAAELAATHVSLYPLWVREGTTLHARYRRGELTLPSEEEEHDQVLAARDGLIDHEFEHYNVFDFVTDRTLRSRYTLLQWEDGDWLGLGPSSISYVAGRHLLNAYSVTSYTESIESRGDAVVAGAFLSTDDRMRRTMMFGLRMLPFECARFARQYGVEVDAVFGSELEILQQRGLVERTPGRIELTVEGVRQINAIGKLFYPSTDDRQSIAMTSTGTAVGETDR